ncbi:methyl-accepting chemotaxis protein [Aphanothece sacrum]|uniref:Methyl-accepting chemotaxis protein n=1 Tax=Aphanothece sacrum FPU1 TaxID=1920663 RepID=A0A401IL53_APHSA|nr:methyl-accepting chemotaxis protein [Aphanothece sacrum]GBF81976.1 methyl-accepting chemotaxis protein [Aphanothece sacrum FPU1]GBF83606.1 methyl-accepting chemotaxis protein [Aphanothece sacrum FPU3]
MTQTSPKPTPNPHQNNGYVSGSTINNPQKQNQNQLSSTQQIRRQLTPSLPLTWWQTLTLRYKAMIVATLIGVVPVVIVGTIAYQVANRAITQQITQLKTSQGVELTNKINRFMSDRYLDIQTIATLETFTNSELRNTISPLEKQKLLNKLINIYKLYDSIAVFDLKGNVIGQSKGIYLKNHKERSYFQEVLKTNVPIMTQPLVSKVDGTFNIYTAAPIKDKATGQTVAIVRARLPVKFLQKLLPNRDISQGEFYLINNTKEVFFAPSGVQITQLNTLGKTNLKTEKIEHKSINVDSIFPNFAQLSQNKLATTLKSSKNFVTYVPFESLENLPDLGWSVIITLDNAMAFASQKQLLSTLLWGTLIASGIVGVLAMLLADQATRPLRHITKTIKQISAGDLDRQVQIQGKDELAVLGTNINQMTRQIKILVEEQIIAVEQANLLAQIGSSIIPDQEALEQIVQEALEGIRTILKASRIVIYRFNPDYSGYISHESVGLDYPKALEHQIGDACISEELIEAYKQGRVVPTDDVTCAGFHPQHLQLMEQLQIRANLVVPVLKQGNLFGLLIAHYCDEPHQWNEREINFLKQVGEQLTITLDRLSLQQQRREDVKMSHILKDITVKISAAINTTELLEIAVNHMRRAIKTDRVIVYRFEPNWTGKIIAESVVNGFPAAIGAEIYDPCFAEKYVDKYQQGRVQATPDIYKAGLTDCHLKQLSPFKVRANLVAPILCKGELLGLFIAHQCDQPRQWDTAQVSFFSQVAAQIGFALERADLIEKQQKSEEEQRQGKEQLQKRALELLIEVDPVSRGDLTIRAKVTEDEIGTIADSYNATIENLRKIVTQVQGVAGQLTVTTNANEVAVRDLSEESFHQAQDISGALESLQAMNISIRAVAANAELAETTVQKATETVEAGEEAMNRTVDGIMAIRQTVAETAKKVKRLGESSQKISKVVNLISSFADQTNLLALNASIEAAHAGEEGRGFAVVADEVRSLARQSAQATSEIETLVASIQAETNDVVAAMEAGTEQVVTGTKLVDETRKSLNQITVASAQITELVEAIAKAAVEQSQTSQTVTQTMIQVAAISDKTSQEAALVSDSFKQLLMVAQSLEESVRQFKVI